MVQSYDFRQEIRPDTLIKPSKSLDPTTMLEIMIETIDRSDLYEKVVGFAYFPLFLHTDGVTSPFSSEVDEYIFNEGCY